MANNLFETYKNNVITHGNNMFKTSPATEMATMWEYP